MQWRKLMGAVPLAVALAACSSNRAKNDTAASGVLSDSLGYGIDTNPAKKAGTAMDSIRAKRDSALRDSLMWDSARKAAKAGKKTAKKGHH